MERTLRGNQTRRKKIWCEDKLRYFGGERGAFIKAIKDELGIALPEEYLKILR